MRTLNRPMFNMGGPIKEGIMTGIREPRQGYALGKEVVKQVGTKVPAISNIYNRGIANLSRLGQKFKGLFGKTGPGTTKQQYQGYSEYGPVTYRNVNVPGTFQPNPVGKYLMGSPEAKALKYVWDGKGWEEKAAAMPFKSPTGALTIGYFGGKWLWPDGTEATDDEVKKELNKKKGDKDYGPYTKKQTLTAAQIEAKAKADKEKRINSLLDTMGYDKARKNAAYDALIDAGRMVSERGTLDPKNITSELINPIVAATSKRFDKPEQIREAVGLMQTKADIQKEMNKEETALANQAKRAQIAVAEKSLAGNTLEETAEALFTRHGSWPSGEALAYLARNKNIPIVDVVDTGNDEVGDPVAYMEGQIAQAIQDGVATPAGNYVIGKDIIIVDSEGNVSRR